jgi:hypothetical protein
MPMHRDRRATLQSAKRGPPRRGARMKPSGPRRLAGAGNQPALRTVPCRNASCGNQDVQMGSNMGLGAAA